MKLTSMEQSQNICLLLLVYLVALLPISITSLESGAAAKCRVKENAMISTVVCSIDSIGLSSQPAKLYLFSFKHLFRISNHRELVVISTIDRESLDPALCKPPPKLSQISTPICTLSVEVVNKTDPKDFKFLNVAVEVEDLNDNAPTFDKLSHTVEIDETHQAPVSGGYGSSSGSSSSGGGNNIVPSLSTGGGSSAAVLLPLPIARDLDAGVNSHITYSLEGRDKHLFGLIQTSKSYSNKVNRPKLKLLQKFDREQKDLYELLLVATDAGFPTKSGEIKLIIRIRDVNDHPPIFHISGNANFKIPEDKPEGSKICDIRITDRDLDSHTTVYINPNADVAVKRHFQVNLGSGLVLITRLDYETTSANNGRRFTIPLIALDNGTPSLSASATVTVNVLDINDNAPRITIDSLSDTSSAEFKVVENQAKGSFVAMVTVMDADSDANGFVYCSLYENGGGLQLDLSRPNFEMVSSGSSSSDYLSKKQSYKLITTAPFDRETKNHYRVTVRCRDKGVPPQSSEQTVTVWIDDLNDSPPTFSKLHYQAAFRENLPPGSEILKLHAVDADIDTNAKTVYRIPAAYQSLVAINDPSSGLITNLVSFDREINKSITFSVLAIDEQRPDLNSSVDVTIDIEDENDCVPVFEPTNYHFKVQEGHSGYIGKLTAYDNDTGANGRVEFFLSANNVGFSGRQSQQLWLLRRDGNIFSDKGHLLDRETQGIHHLTVEARDYGVPAHTSTTMLQIELIDINDNAPSFTQPQQSRFVLQVTESMTVGALATKVTAVDNDESDNGRVSYRLLQNDHFVIGKDSGEIYVNRTLSKTAYLSPRLIVVAYDSGIPSLSTSLYMTVRFASDLNNPTAPVDPHGRDFRYTNSGGGGSRDGYENGVGGGSSGRNGGADGDSNYYVDDRGGREGSSGGIGRGRRDGGGIAARWSSREVLIGLTVGSVVLIVLCGAVLLGYVWCQSRIVVDGHAKSGKDSVGGDSRITGGSIVMTTSSRRAESSPRQWGGCFSLLSGSRGAAYKSAAKAGRGNSCSSSNEQQQQMSRKQGSGKMVATATGGALSCSNMSTKLGGSRLVLGNSFMSSCASPMDSQQMQQQHEMMLAAAAAVASEDDEMKMAYPEILAGSPNSLWQLSKSHKDDAEHPPGLYEAPTSHQSRQQQPTYSAMVVPGSPYNLLSSVQQQHPQHQQSLVGMIDHNNYVTSHKDGFNKIGFISSSSTFAIPNPKISNSFV